MNKNEVIEILKELPEKIVSMIMPLDRFFDYKGALSYAISHLEADRWISVTERLPEKDKNVLVTDNEVDEVYMTFYIGDGLWCCDDGIYDNRITHWRPLPKRAEESEA